MEVEVEGWVGERRRDYGVFELWLWLWFYVDDLLMSGV